MANGSSTDYGAYTDEALQYGKLLGNVLNPPDEANNLPIKLTATTPPGQPPSPAPSSPAAPAPAAGAAPATVTRSGNDRPAGQKSWADYVRTANDKSQQNLDASTRAAQDLENRPSAASQNAPLEARRAQLAQPTPYRDPRTGKVLDTAQQYKPGIGTRIVRGVGALRQGGILGVVDPEAVGATPYGAPNQAYQTTEANRQAQVASLDQQIKQNIDTEKAESERLGKIGSEARATATGEKDIGAAATAQQNAESQEAIREANAQRAEAQEEAARDRIPKNYEETLAAAAVEKDPVRKKALQDAAQKMAETELKKFRYAARATGEPNNDLRQSLIDEATNAIDKMNQWAFDPELNDGKGGFYDPSAGGAQKRIYSPAQFTDLKNQIATKLDADLAKKKFKPLHVRFDVKSTTPGVDQQGNLLPPGQRAAAPAPSGEPVPPQLPKDQMTEGRTGTDAQGNKWKVIKGQLILQKKAGGR